MNQIDNIIGYYKEKIKEHGFTAQGMDWKNEETQILRFEVISKYVEFNKENSLLDVGCGAAAFLDFCNKKNYSINYKGLDVVDDMVNACNEKFGENTAIRGDIFSLNNESSYDYVIASGTFNAKLDTTSEEWETYFYNNLTQMFKVCRKAIVFNTMSEHVDYTYDRLYYPSISQLTKFFVKNFSRDFIVDHSYNLYEMTFCVYKK